MQKCKLYFSLVCLFLAYSIQAQRANNFGVHFSTPFARAAFFKNQNIESGPYIMGYQANLFYQSKSKKYLFRIGLNIGEQKFEPVLNGLIFESDLLAGTESSMHQSIRFRNIGIELITMPVLWKAKLISQDIRTGFNFLHLNTIQEDTEIWYGSGEKEKPINYHFTEIKNFNIRFLIGSGFKLNLGKNTFELGMMASIDLKADEYFISRSAGNKLSLSPFIGYFREIGRN